jgi:hypothetical protein
MPTKDIEKKRAQHARYREKHKEKLSANAKAKHIERMATDPEYVAREKERCKRAYEAYKLRMATDPEYAEKERAKARVKNKGNYNPEKAKAHYEANKEKILAQAKAWRLENSEYVKEYYKKNKERCNQAVKDWIKANPERHKANRKAYEAANKETIREKAKAWAKRAYEQNRDKVVAQRRARKQRQFEKNPEAYRKKIRASVSRSSKRMVDEARDNYIAHLLAKSTGLKLAPSEIPKELIEAKRFQIKILRSIKDEKCNRA